MSKVHFEFAEYLRHANSLRTRLMDVLQASDDGKVAAFMDDVPTIASPDDGAPLTLAFVGQYNAGKSTIISALTSKRDIPIDADVCTDEVTGYDWEGIRLLDTPGIHAGYPDHDELTYRTIDEADLLVFVITSELFDDIIGPHFRDLAFKKDKAREILLVVNKMDMDPGTPEIKRPYLAEVTKPLAVEDFGTVFIDALYYLEALEETDDEDRRELFESAGFDSFVERLNEFVGDRDFMGRLTTPLFSIRSVAQQANAHLSVDMPEERTALELLDRKWRLFRSSRDRLRSTMNGLISQAVADMTRSGDGVAEHIEPGSTADSVEARHEQAQKHVQERCDQLREAAREAVVEELQDLERGLETLDQGNLAQTLRARVEAEYDPGVSRDEYSNDRPNASTAMPSDWSARLQKVGNIANHLGKYAATWTSGPFAQAARLGSATAARGSQGHQVIYNVGKFLGVQFKPWGAVNVAKHIGNAGRVVGAIGGVLGIFAQIYEEEQQAELKRQLRDERDSVRQNYRDAVREIETEFRATYEAFSQDFYGGELEATDKLRDDLVGQRSARTDTANLLGQIASDAQALIQNIQTDAS